MAPIPCSAPLRASPTRPTRCSTCTHRSTSSRPTDCLLLVESPNLPHEVGKGLIDVDSLLGGGLDETAAKVLCELAALV